MEKPRNIDDYIAAFPDDIRTLLLDVRIAILEAVPDAEEAIRYSMPAVKTGHTWLYFCAHKKHIGLYPIYGLEAIEEQLNPYRAKKTENTLHFLYGQPVPTELISTIARIKAQAPKEKRSHI